MAIDSPVDPTPAAIHSLAASPRFMSDGLCFAAGPDGLQRSIDHGATWQDAFAAVAGTDAVPATAVCIAATSENALRVIAAIPGGIGLSDDHGDTWRFVGLPQPPCVITAFAACNEITVLAGTVQEGVLRSTDCGETWAAWNFGLLDHSVECIVASPVFDQDGTVFAGTGTGVYRSRNGGKSWAPVTMLDEMQDIVAIHVSSRFAEDGSVYAASADCGLFISTNAGQSWSRIDDPNLPEDIVAVLPLARAGDEGEILVVGSTGTASLTASRGVTGRTDLFEQPSILTALSPSGSACILFGSADGQVIIRTSDDLGA